MSADTFANARDVSSGVMTIQGAIYKTNILLLLAMCTAAYTWKLASTGGDVMPWVATGALGGFVMAIATCFKPNWAGVTAPIYALLEGLFLGAISALMEARFHGIVIMAVGLTFCTLFGMLILYQTGIIRASSGFVRGVGAATMGIAGVYCLTMILGFFGIQIPYIHDSGPIGIAFSLFVVGVAALNLVIDFALIEQGAEEGAPKYMEWYSGFALMVTLVWLYLEILRLLAKLNSRR